MIRSKPNLIGGFIWDWVDQGLQTTRDDGAVYLAYGGDFGDTPNDGNFCLNGIVASDRTPKPQTWECKYLFQPVAFEAVSLAEGKVRLVNRFHFQNLDQYEIRWQLSESGTPLSEGQATTESIAAGQDGVLTIPSAKPALKPGAEYWLRLSLHETTARPWCEAGFEIAKGQFKLPWGQSGPIAAAANPPSSDPPTLQETASQIVVSGNGFTAKFDRKTGQLVGYALEGAEILKSPLQYNFWRPQTDNDARGGRAHVAMRLPSNMT